MNVKALMVALTLAMPAAVTAQAGAKPATPEMRAALATIEKNVAEIAFKPEKERWQANVDLWKVRIENTGTLTPAEFKKMEPVFTVMEDNVAHLIEPQEQERWVANHALWQVAMGMSGLQSDGEAAKIMLTMAVMQANVARIPPGEEKERWSANVVLWKGMFDKKQVSAAIG